MENNGFRSGFAAIVGRPNVGKSTLMNKMVGQKIAITSGKPQTTRAEIRTVYTCDRGQIIFVDTPGIIRNTKNRLGEYMQNVSLKAVSDADVVLYLTEPETKPGEQDLEIIKKLKGVKAPVLLVINKADTIKKDAMLPVIDAWKKQMDFREIIPISAAKGENLDELLDCILYYLPEGPKFYDEETVTDQPMRQIVSEIIREKALMLLGEEVPHGIAVTVEKMADRPGRKMTDIDATIICEKDSHKGIIIGKGGAMLKKIGTAARFEIEDLIGQQAVLKIWVKVRKDWRDSDTQLKNFGYDEKK